MCLSRNVQAGQFLHAAFTSANVHLLVTVRKCNFACVLRHCVHKLSHAADGLGMKH